MKKAEIIKIPYKPLLFEDSLIGFIEKSYMNKKGEDSLINFIERL